MGLLSGLLRGRVRAGQYRRRAVHLAKAVVAAVLLSAAALPAQTLQPAGSGRLRVFGFVAYEAALSVGPEFRQGDFANHAFALELHYLRDFSAADIARVSLDLMQRAGPIEPEQAQRWQAALAGLLPNIRRGDRLTGFNDPGKGARFVHNGKPVGAIDDAQFARLFFSIWLSESTSEPALRRSLLAGTRP